jgi:phosphonate transport system substrate-binding protein
MKIIASQIQLNLIRLWHAQVMALIHSLLGASVFLGSNAFAQEELKLYIVPQFPSAEILQNWTPIIQEIEKRSGIRLVLHTAKSIPEFENLLAEGAPDIAYLNPYHAVMAKRAAGYEPIIYDASEALTGILVVRVDSPITELAKVKDKTIAFPAPNAFGASLYIRTLLKQKEQIDITAKYVNTHSNVFRQVVSGQVDAGGAIRNTLEKEPLELQKLLRVIYETPPTISHPIVVHPRVGEKRQRQLQDVFLELGRDHAFQTKLINIQMRQPKATSFADYRHLNRLGIEKFIVSPATSN